MPRNVEIKARVPHPAETRLRVESIAGARTAVLLQEDVYFPVPKGRLKLRFLEETRREGEIPGRVATGEGSASRRTVGTPDGNMRAEDERSTPFYRGELIFYDRPDQPGPKTSEYSIFETDRPHDLRAILSAAYGTRAVVKKRRDLFLVGRTRVHLDEVQGLGHFLELEVVLHPGEDVREGEREAQSFMDAFGIGAGQLVTASYVDLLEMASDALLDRSDPSLGAGGRSAG